MQIVNRPRKEGPSKSVMLLSHEECDAAKPRNNVMQLTQVLNAQNKVNIKREGVLLLRHLRSTPTSIFHLAVYWKSISATYALVWSMAAPLLLVCLFALLSSLKLCNRRHCPFVALILLVSLPFLNDVALFYSGFSFLFLMTMSLTTCPVSVIGHLSTLPLHAHYAIHLPFASHALAHPCFCPLLSTSLLLPSTLLLQASALNFCLSFLLPSILLILFILVVAPLNSSLMLAFFHVIYAIGWKEYNNN